MEILMFIGTAYAVLYVMWLLVAVVCGVTERWVDVTLFFVFAPFFLVFCATMALLGVIVSPFVFYFSAKARQEFREKLFEQWM